MHFLNLFWKYVSTKYPFMPHGYCFFWNPVLVSLHVVSDLLITIAYLSIPFTLLYIINKRRDIPFNSMFIWFGLFIIACGATHFLSIITLWYAWYWSLGLVKAITALASIVTAILLIKLIPKIQNLPSQDMILASNKKLLREIGVRKHIEDKLDKQAKFMKLMFEITDIISSITDFKEALQYCLDSICKNLDWPVGHVYLPDPSNKNALLPSDIWYIKNKNENKKIHELTMQTQLNFYQALPNGIKERSRPIWIEDIRTHPNFLRSKIDATTPLRSAAGIPIKVGGEIIAVLELFTLEGAPDAMFILNEAGKIILVNAQTEKIFGYHRSELLNNNVEMVIQQNFTDHYSSRKPLISNDSRQNIINFELTATHKSGSYFPAEINLAPVEIAEEHLILATIRDISERKRIEKMKNEFISIVSHELRTPLTSIYGAIELLMGATVFNNKNTAAQLLMMAKTNSERLIRLINDILDIEKIESGRMEINFNEIDLDKLIQESIIANKAYIDKISAKINYTCKPPNLKIRSDYDRLMQVITNLLSNAVKFSPHNSEVKILVNQTISNKVQFFVIDQGPGIPEKFHPFVFEKFCQADSSTSRGYAGTGLGLSISKSIIENLGGNIYFTTKQGQGTTFCFELPS